MIGAASAAPRPAIEISAETVAGPPFPLPAASYWDKNLLRSCILSMDRMLRQYYDVQEFSHASDNLLRLAVSVAEQRIILDDGTEILPGDPVIGLHLWNERIPGLGPSRCGLGWGSRVRRRIERSLARLAAHTDTNPSLAPCNAFRAEAVFLTGRRADTLSRIAVRLGLGSPVAARPADFGHTALALALAWACHPGGRLDGRLRACRYTFWISRRTLRQRYLQAGCGKRTAPLDAIVANEEFGR